MSLAHGVERLTGIRRRIGPEVKRLTYSVTKHRVELRAHVARGSSGELKPGPGFSEVRWIAPASLADAGLPFGSAARRLLDWINRDPGRLEWS